jgi:hypothetical protein
MYLNGTYITVRRGKNLPLGASKEVGLEVNPEKTEVYVNVT